MSYRTQLSGFASLEDAYDEIPKDEVQCIVVEPSELKVLRKYYGGEIAVCEGDPDLMWWCHPKIEDYVEVLAEVFADMDGGIRYSADILIKAMRLFEVVTYHGERGAYCGDVLNEGDLDCLPDVHPREFRAAYEQYAASACAMTFSGILEIARSILRDKEEEVERFPKY